MIPNFHDVSEHPVKILDHCMDDFTESHKTLRKTEGVNEFYFLVNLYNIAVCNDSVF